MSETFGIYKAMINLNSRGLNQVPRTDLTAPEIAILKKIHSAPNEFLGGIEPVTATERVGEVERTEEEERARLGGIEVDGLIPVFTRKKFEMAFPGEHIPLPREVPGFEKRSPAANLGGKTRAKADVANIMED